MIRTEEDVLAAEGQVMELKTKVRTCSAVCCERFNIRSNEFILSLITLIYLLNHVLL